MFVLLFGLLPGAVTFVLAWLETNKAKPDQDILSVMRLRDRTMWALYLLVMAAIALSGSRVLG